MSAAALLGACGDDPEETTGVPAPTATTTATTPEATPTATVTAEAATPGASVTAVPSEEADPGDEDGNRVDVRFEVRDGEIEPDRVEVPAFLGLRVRVRNRSEETRRLTLDGDSFTVLAAGAEEYVPAEGLQPGEHTLEAEAGVRATIVAVRAGG